MKAPLYVVLLMFVGALIASPAVAQDESASEDSTISAQDAVQATDEATQTTEEAAQATEDAVQAADDAVQTTEDAVETTEDAVEMRDEAVKMTEGTEQPTQDSVTVEWIVNEAPDDAPVTLKGRLIESLGDNEYLFEDETGTVQVEIDDELFGADQFQAGLEIEIVGEVDRDQEEGVEIEVERLNTV